MTKKQKELLEFIMSRKFQKIPLRSTGMVEMDQELVTRLARLVIELAETLNLHNIDLQSQKPKE